ncbi:MAG TPA: LuxR C-terminal-related transcriptional regulator [Mycobacterium sp.]|nr:LuxR C-terminal-related transcriptional regulator [Mycobacterium sp.]
MLATMIERVDAPPLIWSEVGVSELPTGTVTLLLADVEGSTRLWETRPDEMAGALRRLNQTVSETITARHGVRPVEQGEGDSFVAAFARASDAVACALDLQRAPLAPIRIRIGIHTGEVQLRDEGNYAGPTINRTARIRDLAHGGQTVLSAATEAMVLDRLPDDVWLTDLGSYPLRGVPRPQRVLQVCHPDLRNEFPPLRASGSVGSHHLPPQLTTFIGRQEQISDVRDILAANRLVTLTGAGGAGKTRLAIEIATQLADRFTDGVCYVDLAPITDPDLVPVATARSFGLPDQPGRSTMDTLTRSIGEHHMLVVLDNCEHLLDASAALTVDLLGACSRLTFLATSREPIAVDGEVIWRVPSLSLADEAIELFTDRARCARPGFRSTDDNATTVAEICRRLDGMPLAIELAAAQVRALSLDEILDGLRDRFRLLTGGSRRAVRRQQTLHASVDWSHTLLTEPERVLFRRLSVFMGSFNLAAAQDVAGDDAIKSHQILDQLALLVDKSLVVVENTPGRTRYRLLEMVRQYALEKLAESGEADAVRARHRDHYTAMAAILDKPAPGSHEQMLQQTQTEIDNLRAAFAWSCENGDSEQAFALASSLLPLWLARGRILEGLGWFDAVLGDANGETAEVPPAVRARALADRALLAAWGIASDSLDQAEEAVTIARDTNDPALLARALTACGGIAAYNAEAARPYLTEAIGLARTLGDRWRLSQILGWQAYAAFLAGDPVAARSAGDEGSEIADAIGDRFISRFCRNWGSSVAQMLQGDLADEVARSRNMIAEADAAADVLNKFLGLQSLSYCLTCQGKTSEAQDAAVALIDAGTELGGVLEGTAHMALSLVALVGGDVSAAEKEYEVGWQHMSAHRDIWAVFLWRAAEIALAAGNLAAAQRRADEAVSRTTGWHQMMGLVARARVAIARNEPQHAERDAHDGLTIAADIGSQTGVPEVLDCLAAVALGTDSHREAARLYGAAEGIRQRIGAVRFQVHNAEHEASVTLLRDALGDDEFESARAEGAALSTADAIGYARRGRGERKRPASGWAALTPTELDVVRLVSAGLPSKDIATRLFVSPRTVQTHLTHIYTKLGVSSRVQLVQEAARHA